MPTFVKVALFGFCFLGLFFLWMALIQTGFGVNNIAMFSKGEKEIAWGVPLLLLILSPLLFRPFSKILDHWTAGMNQ
ncbi:MAG: hypothetical protein Q9M22_05560 [Mariprofundaceae bacterium]|nr:hypothetical protein [Mariprofundaceae bacterium]